MSSTAPTRTPIGELTREHAEQRPDAAAVTCGEHVVTWRDLEARTNQLARHFRSLGVHDDSLVSIVLPNGAGFIEAVLATWKAGATPQPISAHLPTHERDTILELAQPALVVGNAGGWPTPTIESPTDAPDDIDLSPLEPRIARAIKATTSGGSTGRPKLIVTTFEATAEALVPFGRTMRLTGGVHLATGPLYHNGPLVTSLSDLLLGAHVVVMERFDALAALELIDRHRVTWMYAVPTMMHRIWNLPDEVRREFSLDSLETVMHMAAPCAGWLKRAWIDWLGPDRIWELYSGSEASAITLVSGREWLEHPGTVGRPVVGEVRVLDDDHHDVPALTSGHIWMRRGEGLTASYQYVGSESTVLDGGWETLGDIGHLDEDGFLYVTDRDADMILVGGANVYPAEIEAVLEEHPGVACACVIGLPDEDLGNVPHAIVETTGDSLTADELIAHVLARLSRAKTPRSVEFTRDRLRDDAGKVRRSALRADRLVHR